MNRFADSVPVFFMRLRRENIKGGGRKALRLFMDLVSALIQLRIDGKIDQHFIIATE